MSPTPGLVNAHTHLYSALAALGLPAPEPPPASFLDILRRVWWRLDRALDAASLRASARLYAAEALLHGTTTLVDHHESPCFIGGSLDVLADACDELGMRAFLCYGVTERNGGQAEAQAGIDECRRFARANRRPLVRGLVGLHASFTVSDETLAEAAAACRELRTPLHVHVAEDPADVDDARRRGWGGPLERLLAAGALPAGSVLAHGVHLSAGEVREADALRLWLVHNPRSNEGNGVGWAAALAASDRVALGTDGWPSDMLAEDAALARLSAAHGAPATAAARRLERGRELAAELHELTVTGCPSPAVPGPDADHVEWLPDAAHRAARVVIGGRTVVEGGRLAGADLDEIRARALEALPRVRARMEALA